LLPVENEGQAETFLAAHADFSPKPAAEVWLDAVWPDGSIEAPSSPWLQLTPARNGVDGFFAAIFERAAASASTDEAG
jgi:16S rRNA (cytosine967-C5)-methyltransferase